MDYRKLVVKLAVILTHDLLEVLSFILVNKDNRKNSTGGEHPVDFVLLEGCLQLPSAHRWGLAA